MPTLKGRMFTLKRPQSEYGLMDAMGAGIGALWKSAGRSRLFNWIDSLMKAPKIEDVMVKNLSADEADGPDEQPPLPDQDERRDINRKAA